MNYFEDYNDKLKALYLDFEKDSPFQSNVIYFYEKYIKHNKNINTIIVNNIGNYNFSEQCFLNMKKNVNKVKLTFINEIIYQKNIETKKDKKSKKKNKNENMNNDDIKNFINIFFDLNNVFIYEGYDINNNIVFFNINNKKITIMK